MFLTVHTTAALALSQLPLPSWVILVLSFLSHFVLDAIPHGDNELFNKLSKKSKIISMVSVETAEFFIILLILTIFFTFKNTSPALVLGAIFLAYLPDGLEFLNILTSNKIKLLNQFGKLHHWAHDSLNITLGIVPGFIIQLFFFAALLLIALY